MMTLDDAIKHAEKGEFMREKRDFSLERKGRELTPDTLARILRGTAVEKDASEAYERLTGEKIPELKGENNELHMFNW